MSDEIVRHRARRRIIFCGVAGGIVVATGGCQSIFTNRGDPAASPPVQIEHDDPLANMTPEDRERAYRGAWAEGMGFVEKEQYGLALGAFEKALQLNAESTEAMFNVAACHDAIGDPARAISIYRRILQSAPDDADCYANLGTSYIKMYHRENSPAWRRMARQAWEHSLQLNPEQPVVRRYLAQSEAMD
jgi:tetratricopeptide (TPR) repeat protein